MVFYYSLNFDTYNLGKDPDTKAQLGRLQYVYDTAIVIWIIFGLGYVFMIIGLITETLRKPARRAVKKLRVAEKAVIAKVLQEIVLIKSKVTFF